MTVARLGIDRWAAAGVLLLLLGAAQPAGAQRAATGPPDWPCVQRLIPELSWGAIWTGPAPDEFDESWWADDERGRVVRFATARETPPAAAVERVRDFVLDVEEGERERQLTLLFEGLFERINRERSRTIEAIRGYARNQMGRLERISELVDELELARGADDGANDAAGRLEEELYWERRAFTDRQASLRAMCDQPYLLEERLSRMVRVIQAAL